MAFKEKLKSDKFLVTGEIGPTRENNVHEALSDFLSAAALGIKNVILLTGDFYNTGRPSAMSRCPYHALGWDKKAPAVLERAGI